MCVICEGRRVFQYASQPVLLSVKCQIGCFAKDKFFTFQIFWEKINYTNSKMCGDLHIIQAIELFLTVPILVLDL